MTDAAVQRAPSRDYMTHPISRPLCRDPKPMTPERIVAIARQKGEFRVSWQYRNDTLRRQCRKLCKLGLLKQRRCRPGEDLFVAAAVEAAAGERGDA